MINKAMDQVASTILGSMARALATLEESQATLKMLGIRGGWDMITEENLADAWLELAEVAFEHLPLERIPEELKGVIPPEH